MSNLLSASCRTTGGRTNLAPVDPTGWTLTGVTVTPGQSTEGLDDSDGAYLVSGSGEMRFDVTVPTPGDGDNVVFGMWARSATPDTVLNGHNLVASLNIFQDLICPVPPGTGGDGDWQWATGIGQVLKSATGGSSTLEVHFPVSADYYFYAPTVYYLPLADFTRNEAYRIHATFVSMPTYLQSGCAGTMAGVPLIGHGGLGTDNAFVEGVDPGELTIVGSFTPKKYEPILAADGTVKGWVELLDGTVNT